MEKRIPKETHVVVLMGGWSPEREVSLSSGRACSKALSDLGFRVSEIDPNSYLTETLEQLKPDVVFNALHGVWGEDGTVQALLETLKIPYTHSGMLASALAMDKPKAKLFFKEAGIPVCEHVVIDLNASTKEHPLPPPYVIKPISQGSSIGVKIVRSGDNSGISDFVAQQSHLYGEKALVEPYIPGRELTCAVMGDVALGVTEITSTVGFYDYDAKYTQGHSSHLLPAPLSGEVYLKIQQYALLAHEALGCKGVTRSDFRYNEAEGGGIFLLETNTQPGMTETSLVPEMIRDVGHSFHDLVEWLVNDAGINR